jgi:hypothetical protein
MTAAFVDARAPDAESLFGAACEQAATVQEISGRAADRLQERGGIGALLRYASP